MSSNTMAHHKLYSNRIFRYRPILAYRFEDDTNIYIYIYIITIIYKNNEFNILGFFNSQIKWAYGY